MTFRHLEPKRAIIGYSDEPVAVYVRENIAQPDAQFFLPLELLERDSNAYVASDDGNLHIFADGLGSVVLGPNTAVYARLFVRTGNSAVPGLRRFIEQFACWSEAVPRSTPILNRAVLGGASSSKLSHLWVLGDCGFAIPDAVMALSPEPLRHIAEPIGKGNCTIRTKASRPKHGEIFHLAERLALPTLVQQFIKGRDVRIHFVGSSAFALQIDTEADDYRYAREEGHQIDFQQIQPPADVVEACWRYMKLTGLEFAGFDFKVDFEGKYWVLECNSMPGFAYFDRKLDGQILQSIEAYLLAGYSHLVDDEPLLQSLITPERIPSLNVGLSGVT